MFLGIQVGEDGLNFFLGDNLFAITFPDSPELRTLMIFPFEVIPDPLLDHLTKNLKGKSHQQDNDKNSGV